jgi:hypothetical protein
VRSSEERARVAALVAEGLNDCAIVRQTEIPRSTIREWRAGPKPRARLTRSVPHIEDISAWEYSYLLGAYLGDGYLAPAPPGRTSRQLRIYLDAQYPAIILECACAIEDLFRGRRAGLYLHPTSNMVIVSLSSTDWESLFPQHGPGMKHTRRIGLAGWQRELVQREPGRFVRGLIHSDGSRTMNCVRSPAGKEYVYPRYEFSNMSEDIRGLFTWACDLLGVAWKPMNHKTISVARRDSVARLDEFVGPKR